MKILARFHGRVNRLGTVPERSYVTLTNLDTKESQDTDAITSRLLENGIDQEGCEFEVIIQQLMEGKTEAIMRKLEPKPVSPERVEEIRKECEDLKDFCIWK